MEGLLSGLVFAAISALTYLAYKHPKPFQWFAPKLLWVITAAWLLPHIWQYGRLSGARAVIDFVPLDERFAAMQSVEDSVFTSWIWITGYAAFGIYMIFLMTLPAWLHEEEPIDPKRGGE